MSQIITQRPSKLIKNILLVALVSSCFAAKQDTSTITLITADSTALKTKLAITLEEQAQGLSGVRPEDFADDQAMLFFYTEDGVRQFWMPDTYFNLDVFFLDEELRVIDIERNVPSHPGRREPIPRIRPVYARHVLELKAQSPHARRIKIGDLLKWEASFSQAEIESKIRLSQ